MYCSVWALWIPVDLALRNLESGSPLSDGSNPSCSLGVKGLRFKGLG